jgi:hypothetical protein
MGFHISIHFHDRIIAQATHPTKSIARQRASELALAEFYKPVGRDTGHGKIFISEDSETPIDQLKDLCSCWEEKKIEDKAMGRRGHRRGAKRRKVAETEETKKNNLIPSQNMDHKLDQKKLESQEEVLDDDHFFDETIKLEEEDESDHDN